MSPSHPLLLSRLLFQVNPKLLGQSFEVMLVWPLLLSSKHGFGHRWTSAVLFFQLCVSGLPSASSLCSSVTLSGPPSLAAATHFISSLILRNQGRVGGAQKSGVGWSPLDSRLCNSARGTARIC